MTTMLIKSVHITPNPVAVSSKFLISVDVQFLYPEEKTRRFPFRLGTPRALLTSKK